MIAIIKSIKDWKTIAHAEVLSYDAPIISNDNAVGTINFAPDADVLGYEGNWICIGRKVWLIKSVKPSETGIDVTVQDAYNAFYRSHRIGSAPTTSTGAFLEAIFRLNYKNQPDTEYAMPYLNITNTDDSDFIQPDLKSDTVFVMSDYLRLCAKMGVIVRIAAAAVGSGLDVVIESQSPIEKVLVFGDGHSELIAQSYNATITSKVTAIQNNVQSYYYLQEDGTVSQTEPDPRIDGLWETIVLSENQVALDEVNKVFAKNTATLKIEFYSDKVFQHGEVIRFRGNGKTQKAAISYVAVKSDDYRYHYKAGDMAVTLTDKLKLALNT